jgi:hypothetical protein
MAGKDEFARIKIEQPMTSINRLVLVLNASFEPINICPARRAVTMVFNGLAAMEESSPPGRSARSRVKTSCCATAIAASTAGTLFRLVA